MNQKVIHNLPTTMVHATSIHYSKASSSQILASKYLSPCRHPNKKGNPPKGLHTPNTFQGKMKEEDPPQSIIIGINVKVSIFLQSPPTIRLQKMKKIHNHLQLTIIKIPKEPHIPTPLPHILSHQQRLHWSFPIKSILIQNWESHFERLVTTRPTPIIKITNFKV